MKICPDKGKLDIKAAREKLEKCLKRNYYRLCREWPYKNVKPCILAEEYMEDVSARGKYEGLLDYKFYCFNGMPRFLYVSQGLGGNHAFAKMNFVDLEWNKTPFQRPDFMEFDVLPSRPYGFETMIELSAILSANIPFVRVDWYSLNRRVFFSEMTFTPGGGMTLFSPSEWEREIGDWISLNN